MSPGVFSDAGGMLCPLASLNKVFGGRYSPACMFDTLLDNFNFHCILMLMLKCDFHCILRWFHIGFSNWSNWPEQVGSLCCSCFSCFLLLLAGLVAEVNVWLLSPGVQLVCGPCPWKGGFLAIKQGFLFLWKYLNLSCVTDVSLFQFSFERKLGTCWRNVSIRTLQML